MAHTELRLRERRTIEDILKAKISVDKIAAEIGRDRSTIFRESNATFPWFRREPQKRVPHATIS